MKMNVSPTYLTSIGETLLSIQNIFEIPELTEDVFMTTSKVDRGIGILPELIVFLFLSKYKCKHWTLEYPDFEY